MSVAYPKVYRFSNLGTSLTTALSHLKDDGAISEEQRERILQEFDKRMALEFDKRRSELPKAKIHGEVSFYKRLYDTWTFSLENWLFDIDNKESIVEKEAKFFTTMIPKTNCFVCSIKYNNGGDVDDDVDDGFGYENDFDDVNDYEYSLLVP